jgi:RNA polymerase sigma-54 factor
MAIELKQSVKLAQQLVMTPQLQQAIKLLQLSRLELTEAINQEMLENPVLEELAETDLDPEAETRHTDDTEGEKPEKDEDSYDDIDWEKFLDDVGQVQFTGQSQKGIRKDEDLPSVEATLSQPITLTDHLLWQLKMSSVTIEEEAVGELIIGNLNDDGYLTAELEMIAQEAGTGLAAVEAMLNKIQRFDPIGVAARDLRECLTLQARQFAGLDPIVEQIITSYMHQLENKDYRAISRGLKVSINRVQEAVKFVQGLEPKPGRPFAPDRSEYITPDIYVYKIGDDYTIVLNEDGLPKLRVSHYYRRILKDRGKDLKITREYIQDKLRSAVWLIRSLHQRQRTIYKVMESILKHQRDFFDRGIANLKPMILHDVAQDIQMHESTVSRVTTNKYVYTPQGIFPLKFFFNSKINTTAGGEVAAETVKERIRQLIEAENPRKPLSDQEIVIRLKEYGIDIARRTVTKYREMMSILSSAKRKRLI